MMLVICVYCGVRMFSGVENPSYCIADDEQPSTSYHTYDMFQPSVCMPLTSFAFYCAQVYVL